MKLNTTYLTDIEVICKKRRPKYVFSCIVPLRKDYVYFTSSYLSLDEKLHQLFESVLVQADEDVKCSWAVLYQIAVDL